MKERAINSATDQWVLIVEDDAFIDKAYSAKFAHEGIKVKIAQDGEQALEILKAPDTPAIILLDLMIPIKNGFEVLEIIKKDQALAQIPVIILSNLAQEADEKRGIELGAKEYLVKSDIRMEQIIEKVKQYLR